MSSSIYQLQNGSRSLTFNAPRIMGVLNCTPDSFFAGSRSESGREAVKQGRKLIAAGADVLDIGGQSSRPGATEVGAAEEWQRIEGAIKGLLDAVPEAIISVDTFHHEVALRALEAGAFMINDIYGGSRDTVMAQVISEYNAPYAIMHMQGNPATMQTRPAYDDISGDVFHWLQDQMSHLKQQGIEQFMVDVGFGFGKTTAHNFQLLRELDQFQALNAPLLVGVSRKSMVYKTLNGQPETALNGTTALHAWALERGAHMLRVHDVEQACEVVKLHGVLFPDL
ncbi:MAG: dihydropteroate synthase [Flavobacteriales bacterium]|nr:dihydropteroate synthase [Flavobacteriales bacterium]